MMKSIEKSGKTEDAAIAAALEELGLAREDVQVEIVERAKSGFLGIGASPAVVRVSYEAPDEAAAPEAPAPVVKEEAPAPEESVNAEELDADHAAVYNFLSGLMQHMGGHHHDG